MLNDITIQRLLPNVFIGMEQTQKILSSQIWEEESFVFQRGCRICLQAESGSGKSSLLSFIFGNRTDYKGRILFNNTDIRTFSIQQWCEIRKTSIALLPQDMRLFPELTVAQNIDLKNNVTAYKSPKEITSLLEKLGIEDKKDVMVGKLSIGQMQRVAIIRTICQPFDFIFLDEPVSHLDERNNRIVAEIITDEAKKQGAGIVATSVGNHLLLDQAQFIAL